MKEKSTKVSSFREGTVGESPCANDGNVAPESGKNEVDSAGE